MASPKIYLCDYAVAFIDLLGQKAEMPGRHLPTDPKEAIALVKKSVGRIVATQKSFQQFFDSYASVENIYRRLPPQMQNQLPDMAPGELKWQRFSDGFVIYVPLGNGLVKSPVNSLFGLLMAAGLHCMIGLAGKAPVRVGIDVAWGVEYRPGEIYGAAVAYSHKLESKIAQWPRVVIGDGLVDYLRYFYNSVGYDLSSQYRRTISRLCLNLVHADSDSQNILHYLGPEFREASHDTFDGPLVDKAKAYIEEQLRHWRHVGDKKLETRYEEVADYFARYGVDN